MGKAKKKKISKRRARKVFIDRQDVKLLEELRRRARRTDTDIGLEIGATHVGRMTKALIKKEVIQGFSARLNWKLLGYSCEGVVMVRLLSHTKETIQNFQEQISHSEEFNNVLMFFQLTDSTYDYCVWLRCRDKEDFDSKSERIQHIKGVDRIWSAPQKGPIQHRRTLKIEPLARPPE